MKITHRSLIAAATATVLLSVVAVFAFVRVQTGSKPTTAGPTLEVERVTLREWGTEPRSISRRPGPFVLIVENRSGLGEVQLSLVEESGHVRNRIPVTKNALSSKQQLELPPGTYLIKDADRSEWQCQLTISSH